MGTTAYLEVELPAVLQGEAVGADHLIVLPYVFGGFWFVLQVVYIHETEVSKWLELIVCSLSGSSGLFLSEWNLVLMPSATPWHEPKHDK